MSAKPVKITFVGDESDLARSLKAAGGDLDTFATGAQTAGNKAEAALSGVGDKADAVGSASSQAAGGIGDLGGALSLMPGPLGAVGAGMEAAAPAIMGVTGAADLLNLATTKFPALAKAQTVATNAMAGAQKALNLVMAGNPIALVVLAIVALIAIFAVLYAKNEGFRLLVNKVFGALVDGVNTAKDKLGEFLGAAREKLEAAAAKFGALKDGAVNAIGSYSDSGGGVLGKLHDVVSTIGTMKDQITSKAAGMWDGIKDSFKGVINTIIGWWNDLSFSIDIPNAIPGLPNSFTISTPNIPMMANGGIVTSPTLAIIGEDGPEAVVPLDGRFNTGNVTIIHYTQNVPVGANLAEVGRVTKAALDAFANDGGRRAA